MDAPKIETLPSPTLPPPSAPARMSPAPAAIVPKKRPAPDDEDELAEPARASKSRSGARVTCQACGETISFHVNGTGEFTMAHWNAHREKCDSQPSPSPGPSSPKSFPPASTHPSVAPTPSGGAPAGSAAFPTSASAPPRPHSGPLGGDERPEPKRRRAKRTEEQRIEYFRSDPFVAEVEAYRVLCGSCNKWIRLRPNSTYCSIPWDSHRKSCLAKNGKLNGSVRGGPATPTATSTPPAPAPLPTPADVPPPAPHQLALASASAPVRVSTDSSSDAQPSSKPPSSAAARSPAASDDQSPEARVLESRRKSADQRRAALVADPMLTAVEPSRVFCSLCQKWVQLRQDSTYCAYPWVQHRSKCVSRHQRRTEKAAEIASQRAQRDAERGSRQQQQREQTPAARAGSAAHSSASASGSEPGDVESEDEDAEGDPVETVELASPDGRARFVRRALAWLQTTTYAHEDDVGVEPLVRFLNAALPAGKFEHFERPEVELVLDGPAPMEGIVH